ncbi:short-chain dehydrogenase reductase 3b-like [Lycium ferocissimum]|uniref:short-chain dehydrogenase reductase 3b-like n=1 Tax=Lycium ferocissimum TaxID=112874 RepID=UPI002815C8B7|nr:short-chain dehydrogenase reductase 3b-like [Lycium ferocissimum]
MDSKKLEGKIAIITGGASGIGEATSRLFAQHGAKIVIADIQEEKGRSVTESIGSSHCTFIKCDVTDEKQVQSLVQSTVEIHGKVNIMFSNAGIASTHEHEQDILGFNLDALDNLFAINVRGSVACVKHAAKAMVESGVKGNIICTASLTATMGITKQIDYAMSKHAVLGLVKCASKGLGKYGIRVNCVSPAAVATPLLEKSMKMSVEDLEKLFESFNCLKNGTLRASHVADAVLFLASDDSQFVTGHNLVVDGGFHPPV